MKILVFDDTQAHRDAAKAQLTGHDLTVVGTYDEARELVTSHLDYKKAEQILKDQFGDFNPWQTKDEEKKQAYFAAQKVANEQATTHPSFDVVLVDLLVPASDEAQGSNGYKHIGKEMPVGSFIAFLAAKNGAKYAAVHTDSSHHDHPAAACFDAFNDDGESEPTTFMVNGCKVILSNNRNWVKKYDPTDLAKPLEYDEYKNRTDCVRAKDWAAVLKYLTKE